MERMCLFLEFHGGSADDVFSHSENGETAFVSGPFSGLEMKGGGGASQRRE